MISDTGLSLFDENGVCNGRVPAAGLSQAWGIQEGESYWLPDPSIMAEGEDDLAALRAPHGVDIAPVDDTPPGTARSACGGPSLLSSAAGST